MGACEVFKKIGVVWFVQVEMCCRRVTRLNLLVVIEHDGGHKILLFLERMICHVLLEHGKCVF